MEEHDMSYITVLFALLLVVSLAGVRVVRHSTLGLVERLGKYHHSATPGFTWVVPVLERMTLVDNSTVMLNEESRQTRLGNERMAAVGTQPVDRLATLAHSLTHNAQLVFRPNGELASVAPRRSVSTHR
jgi:regulator of protease activity HflC (stomatin/prohibitin superfamily)